MSSKHALRCLTIIIVAVSFVACGSGSGKSSTFQESTKNLTPISVNIGELGNVANVNHPYSLSVRISSHEQIALVPIAFFAAVEVEAQTEPVDDIYLGGNLIDLVEAGEHDYLVQFVVDGSALNHDGNYRIYAVVDPADEIVEEVEEDNRSPRSSFQIELSSALANTAILKITEIGLAQSAVILGDEVSDGEQYPHFDGYMNVVSEGAPAENLAITMCAILPGTGCEAVSILDHQLAAIDPDINVPLIEANEKVTVGFEIYFSSEQYQRILNSLNANGIPVTFQVTLHAASPVRETFVGHIYPPPATKVKYIDGGSSARGPSAVYEGVVLDKKYDWSNSWFGITPIYSARSTAQSGAQSTQNNLFMIGLPVIAFGKNFDAFQLTASSSKNVQVVTGTRQIGLKVFGINLVSISAPFSVAGGIEWEEHKVIGQKSPTKPVKLGPVRIEVSAEMGLRLGATAGVEISSDGITAMAGPFADLGATAKAEGGSKNFKLGVEGNLTLVNDTIAFEMGSTASLSDGHLVGKFFADLYNEIKGPNGSLKAFAQAWIFKGSVTFVSFKTVERKDILKKFADVPFSL